MTLSAFVALEIERLGARFTRSVTPRAQTIRGHVVPAEMSVLLDGSIEWPKGVTYRTVADNKADREVWWAELNVYASLDRYACAADRPFACFGTSHQGNVFLCVALDDARPNDPMLYVLRDGTISASTPLSIFFSSLEREPTRKRR